MKNPKNLKAITLAVTASQDEVSNELGDFTNSDIFSATRETLEAFVAIINMSESLHVLISVEAKIELTCLVPLTPSILKPFFLISAI